MLDSPGMNWWSLFIAWLLGNGLLLLAYRRALFRLWREPVLRHPVLIVESDDWGAGPLSQAEALRRLAAVLDKHRDGSGRSPVLTLALILAVPDGPAIRASGRYHRRALDAPPFADILAALREGAASGVFALQLHGLEHYWPEALLSRAETGIRDWLRSDAPPASETLPAPLQSRWVNASSLPSRPHDDAAIRAAAADEVRMYTAILGVPPKVVVPPTFVWTRAVEKAWAEQGIDYVVTPGWRYTCRNAQGLPDCQEGPIANGARGQGVGYLVRYEYFEPRRGRDAAHALRALDKAVSQGRPCLLENHRDNFMNDVQAREHSVAELDKLCRDALVRHAHLRFLSTLELGRILGGRDPEWIETGFWRRLPAVVERLRASGRFWKLATLTGLAWLLSSTVHRLVPSTNGKNR